MFSALVLAGGNYRRWRRKKECFFRLRRSAFVQNENQIKQKKKTLNPRPKKGLHRPGRFFFLFCHLRIHKKHYRIYTVINRINGPNENGKNTRNTKRRRQWLLSQTELSTPTDRHRFDFAAKCNLALVLSQFLRLNSNKLNHFIA